MEKRVVVTGLGIVSPVGNDVDTFWRNLLGGVCGIEEVPQWKEIGAPVTVAGTIKNFNPEAYGLEKPFVRKQDLFVLYAAAAAKQAMDDSGLVSGQNIEPIRLCTYVGSGFGGLESIQREAAKIVEDPSGQWVSPNLVATAIGNLAGGQIAIRFGAKGSCLDVVTACATATHSIGEAFRTIRHGYADAAIAGGTEHVCVPLAVAGFANAHALSRETDPKHASLPFNRDRGGFVMADGAAILILEEYEHALNRGAKIYAEIVGYGTTCDAYHATAPRPDATTQAQCIWQALSQASFDPSKDCLYINAHGTGTHLNDLAETMAYKLALGEEAAARAHISSTKSEHGHMFGATGAAEAIAAILALRDGMIPPTINLDVPDPECDLNYTPNVAVKADATIAISDSFGFGGHNACLAFRKIA